MSIEAVLIQRSVKQKILDRLYDAVSVCDVCSSKDCSHYCNRSIPDTLSRRDVIKAIGLGETFFEDNKNE